MYMKHFHGLRQWKCINVVYRKTERFGGRNLSFSSLNLNIHLKKMNKSFRFRQNYIFKNNKFFKKKKEKKRKKRSPHRLPKCSQFVSFIFSHKSVPTTCWYFIQHILQFIHH